MTRVREVFEYESVPSTDHARPTGVSLNFDSPLRLRLKALLIARANNFGRFPSRQVPGHGFSVPSASSEQSICNFDATDQLLITESSRGL
jgi:hypothetical protein